MTTLFMPSVYFGNALYYSKLTNVDQVTIEAKEHFIKQTFRNRCEILGANGTLNLIIPVKKWKNHTPIDQIRISYAENWQVLHWRSITSAYRSSPYFEFYEQDFSTFFENHQHDTLLAMNQSIQEKVLSLLKVQVEHNNSDEYLLANEEHRTHFKYFSPKTKITHQFPTYLQVFDNHDGFVQNLSILDLLFNLGPETLSYLNRIG